MPRIIIKFKPIEKVDQTHVNKHHIQAFIYERLRNTPYDSIHEFKKYKFFSFSDILPVGEYYQSSTLYSFFISSPDKNMLRWIKDSLKENSYGFLGPLHIEVKKVSMISPRLKKLKFISASPVVVKYNNSYVSFKHGSHIGMFLDMLKKNAVDKYRTYYNEDPVLYGELFEKMLFKKSVSIRIVDQKETYNVIGSMWSLLEKPVYGDRDERKFYEFLFDTGIGVKNSLGFGALNEHPTLYQKKKSKSLNIAKPKYNLSNTQLSTKVIDLTEKLYKYFNYDD